MVQEVTCSPPGTDRCVREGLPRGQNSGQSSRTHPHLKRQTAERTRGRHAKGKELSKGAATESQERADTARSHSPLTQHAHTARSHTQPAGRGAARPRPRRLTLLSGSPGSAASSLETNLSTLLSEACLLWPMLFSKCAC